MYEQVLTAARNVHADYVAYRGLASWVVVCVADGVIIANCDDEGMRLIAAGVAARKQSFLDFTNEQFLSGTVAQLAVTRDDLVAQFKGPA